jgi:hypothetical protein
MKELSDHTLSPLAAQGFSDPAVIAELISSWVAAGHPLVD